MSPSPPRLAERLVRATAADAAWADAIAGDLHEEFLAVAQRVGAGAARRWYWREALGIAGHRLFAGRRRRRRPTALPDAERLTGRWHVDLRQDLRASWRGLTGQPGVSLTIVAALALGLAANATIFALGDALVLRPFRFAGVERTVLVASAADEDQFFGRESVTPGDFIEWAERTTDTFAQLAAMDWWNANLSGRDYPEQVAGFRVSPAFFKVMDVQPVLGRTLAGDDARPGAPRVVVLSHGLWMRRFGADAAIVGRTIRVDGEPCVVAGVAAKGFASPFGAELWGPLVLTAESRLDRTSGRLMVIGRLRDGVPFEAARARVQAVVGEQRRTHPATNAGRSVTVRTYANGFGDPGAPAFIAIWQAAALLLLLVAGANVVNLLLARGVERQREFAIRLAIGAGRGRIVYQLLLEGLLLAGLAVVAATGLAWAAIEATRAAFPPSIIRFVPGWDYLHIQPRTVMVTAALAAIVTVVSSLVPALKAAGSAVVDELRQGTRMTAGAGRQRLRTVLATLQIALTVGLLTAAGLTVAAARRVTEGPLGFVPDHVLTARLALPPARYDAPGTDAFVGDVLGRLGALPSVNAAAAMSVIPYSGTNASTSFWVEGVVPTGANAHDVDLRTVTPEWSDALRVPLRRGRGISAADRADAPQIGVVSESLARTFWPGRDPIGRRFRLDRDGPLVTVVGTVGEVARYWLTERDRPTVYRPMAQAPPSELALMLRVAGDPLELGAAVRAAVAAVDPQQPVASIRTYQQVIAESTFGLRFAARALGVIAFVAFVVSVVGVYSLMAYLASRRTRELGVRLALGATRAQIVRLTVGHAVRIAGAGALCGIVLASAIGRLLENALFGVVSANHALALAIGVTLGAAAVAASYLPARRAAGVDPLVALRAE